MDRNKIAEHGYFDHQSRFVPKQGAHWWRAAGLAIADHNGDRWANPYTYRPRDGGPQGGSIQPTASVRDTPARASSRGHLCLNCHLEQVDPAPQWDCSCQPCRAMWGAL